ncbi:MAG: M23 family metallopeptidase [Brevinematia bacterium]
MKRIFFLAGFIFFLFSCQKVGVKEEIYQENYWNLVNARPYEIVFKSENINRGGSGVICLKRINPDIESFYLIVNENHKINFIRYKGELFISFIAFPLSYTNLSLSIVSKRGDIEETNFVAINTCIKGYGVRKISMSSEFGIDKGEELGEKMPEEVMKRYDRILKKFSEKTVFNVFNYTSQNQTYRENFSFNPVKPVSGGKVTSDFGIKRNFVLKNRVVRTSFHMGIDYVNGKNFDIYSIEDGTVVFSGYNGWSGNFILIDHGFGIFSAYAHCSRLLVKSGDKVRKGELIAISGSTGYATGDHLHFSLIINGTSVNPHEWLDREWVSKNVLPALLKE